MAFPDQSIGQQPPRPSFSLEELERLRTRLEKQHVSPENSLAVRFPEIAAQLHPELNGCISADMIPSRCGAQFIWQCPECAEHTWKATPQNRTSHKTSRCPYCLHRKIDSMSSLLVLRADLAAEWDFEGNGSLRPEHFSPGSDRLVSWRCKDDFRHCWKAKISQRNIGYMNCPYCSGKYVTDSNRLSILFPEIAAEFHTKKNRMLYAQLEVNQPFYPQNKRLAPQERPNANRRLRASDLAFDTSEIVWWFCSKDSRHEDWRERVRSRTSEGYGCPSCSHKNVAPHDSLAAKYPKLSGMFHSARNAPATASSISCGSERKMWWQCLRDRTHVFRSSVKSIVRSWDNGNSGCAICSHRKVGSKTSLAAVYPEVASLLIYTVDKRLLATEVCANSNLYGAFQCRVSEEHVWTSKIQNVVECFKKRGRSGCPFCYGLRVTPKNSLDGLYPIVAKHLDRREETIEKSTKISPGSHKVVPFRCLVNDTHRWRSEIREAVKRFKKGKLVCPFCQ